MAEFCLECWNRINETNDDESKFFISKDLDLCEGCGEWKHVVEIDRKSYYRRRFRIGGIFSFLKLLFFRD